MAEEGGAEEAIMAEEGVTVAIGGDTTMDGEAGIADGVGTEDGAQGITGAGDGPLTVCHTIIQQ